VILKGRALFVFLPLCLLLLFSAPSFADEAENPPKGHWKGGAEIGGVATSGNTDTRSLNVRMNIENEREKWSHSASMESYYSQGSDGESRKDAQKLTAEANSAYKLTERNYTFADAGYENDRFSGYKYRFHESAGLGRVFVKTGNVMLKIEAGVGGRHSRLDNDSLTDELIAIGAVKFRWNIGPSSVLAENLSVKSGNQGTVIVSRTALKAHVAGAFSIKLSLDVNQNSNPPEDKKNTDTITSVTLVYDF